VNRHTFLQQLHHLLHPRTYVETGIDKGQSLTHSRVPSIGIDPAFSINRELKADVYLARTTSDELFARKDPLAHLPKPFIDFAFIDGMHLSEYAMRDYLAIERFTLLTSVVVFDDMLPRNIDEAARRRHTGEWTGDVYKAVQALRDQRPDLITIEVDTAPTGVVVVLLPDASKDGILPGYDDWMDVAMLDDPQDVPPEILTRSRAVDPAKLLASPGWKELVALRQVTNRRNKHADEVRRSVRTAFADFI
jgi:hypothetical protein